MSSKSVEKRDRQNAKRRLRNRAAKSTFRTAVKKFEAQIAAGDKAKAEVAMAEAQSFSILLQERESFTRTQPAERRAEWLKPLQNLPN